MGRQLNREKQALLVLLLVIAVTVITLRFSCSSPYTQQSSQTDPSDAPAAESQRGVDADTLKGAPARERRNKGGESHTRKINGRKQPKALKESSPLDYPVKTTDERE